MSEMSNSNLFNKLSRFGSVQMLKEGVVFTLLITGTKLTGFNNYNSILEAVTTHTKDKYPLIECMKNEDNFFLIVLKKKK